MTRPIGNLLAPTACEDTLQQGADNFNIHVGCTTQDDHAQYLKTCSVRRAEIEVVFLSTGDNKPAQTRLGNYPTLAFSTCAQSIRFSLNVPLDMNVDRESKLFAVLAAETVSTNEIRSKLSYLKTCYASGNPEAAANTTSNTVPISSSTGRFAEGLVGTFTSGDFYQLGALSFQWTRDASSTAQGDSRAGDLHVAKFLFQYFDRRTSTST